MTKRDARGRKAAKAILTRGLTALGSSSALTVSDAARLQLACGPLLTMQWAKGNFESR